MSAGLAALLDDVAVLARAAAASVDDVAAGAGRASMKAAGVVVDDAAVTPRYVQGFRPERELPMIKRIAVGSLRNKLLFILPAALVLSEFLEWLLTGGGKRTTAGLIQIALLFISGLLLSFSLLLAAQLGPNASQALPGIATLLGLVGTLMAAVRLGRAALGVSWIAGPQRHLAMAVGFLVLAKILEALLVQQFIAAQGDVNKVSIGLLHSLDHSYFIGLMTNTLFGAILVLTADRPRVWPWADQLIFWGLNIGALAFIFVLLTVGSGEGAKPFTHPVSFTAPIMGLAALLGVATLLMRLQSSEATSVAPMRA